MNPKQKQEYEWAQADLLLRFPPEFLEIVGKHSTLWSKSKMETLLEISNWLAARDAQHEIEVKARALKQLERFHPDPETSKDYKDGFMQMRGKLVRERRRLEAQLSLNKKEGEDDATNNQATRT